jgi:hypothetical protein
MGAGYLKLTNTGATDRLITAQAEVSEIVELHTHINDNGVMRMRKVEAIDIAAGGKTELVPGGLHIMFINLKAPLKDGDTFPVTLKFEKAGEIKVPFKVDNRQAGGSAHKHE